MIRVPPVFFLISALSGIAAFPLPAQPAAAPAGEDSADDFTEDDFLLLEGEGLSVVGTRELNQQMVTITREEIAESGGADLTAVLEKTLNVNAARNGGYGNVSSVSLRGFGGGRVAILVDGVPVNSPQSGSFDLGKIGVASVEKIEVIYGGADTKYNVNGAIGGVINIITLEKKKKGFSAGGGFSNLSHLPASSPASLLDTQNLNFNLSYGTEAILWKLDAGANRADNKYLFRDTDKTLRTRMHNEIWDGSASTSLSFFLADGKRLSLAGRASYADKNIPGPVGSLAYGKQNDVSVRESVLFDAPYLALGKADTELSVSHAFDSLAWKDASVSSRHDLNSFTVINRWSWYAAEALTLTAGADAEVSLLSSTDLGEKSGAEGGAYLTAEISAGKKITLVPSVKMIKANASVMPVPKLGLVYRMQNGFTVKNNYFRVFKLPAFNDKYWPADAWAEGNPGLRAEDGVGGDLVVSGEVKNILSFQSAFHATWLRDAILWQPTAGVWRPENIGEALYAGSDLSVKSAARGGISLSADYSFLLTYVLSDSLGFSDDKRMPYKPLHTFGAGAEFAWKGGSLSVSEHFESARYTSTLNVNELPSFFTMDAAYRQNLDAQKNVFVSIRNLFNEAWYSVDGYPLPGTSITAGIRMQFN